ncbi:MAG: DUF2147 domain-containing protein [bacterium]|nr:DUF2147 domain-containing protein [bacterium]
MIIGAVAACLMIAISLPAGNCDTVLGVWLVPKKDAKITIKKCGSQYCGNITWLKDENDLDTKNPEEKLRKRKVLGIKLLWRFKCDDGEWTGGKIYDPDSGKTYSCKMWMKGNNKLNVKGYVGISLFGRSEVWTRTN